MKRTTAGSDSKRRGKSDRRHEPESESSGATGRERGSAAALHGAVGNQAVQRSADGDDRSRATADDEASTVGSARAETTVPGVQRSVDPEVRNGTADGAVQPKLAVSQPGDPTEREAERVADEAVGTDTARGVTVSRRATSGSGTVDGDTESQIRAVTSGGRPLPESTRSSFESRFDRDFSDVRIHTGQQADAAARSIDAEAFTRGSDIVFRCGKYNPNTTEGAQLLAHELTHVVQQRHTPATTAVHRQEGENTEADRNGEYKPRHAEIFHEFAQWAYKNYHIPDPETIRRTAGNPGWSGPHHKDDPIENDVLAAYQQAAESSETPVKTGAFLMGVGITLMTAGQTYWMWSTGVVGIGAWGPQTVKIGTRVGVHTSQLVNLTQYLLSEDDISFNLERWDAPREVKVYYLLHILKNDEVFNRFVDTKHPGLDELDRSKVKKLVNSKADKKLSVLSP
jgi:hypothetical protein